jgi:hypothetical protein
MPLPGTRVAAARDDVLTEAVHAVAMLVLHVAGEQRLERNARAYFVKVLKALTSAAETPDVRQKE